jgi:protease-4
MQDAIAKAAQLANLGGERGIRYLEPTRNWRETLLDAFASDDSGDSAPDDAYAVIARQPEQQLLAALAEVRMILSGPTIQARCLECPVAPVAIKARDRSLLSVLEAWLS